MRRIVISVAVLMFLLGGLVHAQFEPVPPTIVSYVIMVDEAMLDGVPLTEGDQIGVFDDDLCVGVSTVNGVWPLVIVNWQQDLAEFLPGYAPGNNMSYRYWTAETGDIIQDVEAVYSLGDGTFGDPPLSEVSLSAVRPPSHDIEVSVAEINFGAIEVGHIDTQTVMVSNIGGTDLTITAASIVGDFVFSIPVYENVILEPGETDEIDVAFVPDLEMDFEAELQFASDDPDEPVVVVTLTGEGYVNRHFVSVEPTNITDIITVNMANIEDEDLEAGDAIGIFDGNICVGVHLIQDPVAWPIQITAYGMEGENPGYTEGDPIRYQIFDMGTERVLLARANYIQGDGTFGFVPGTVIELQAHDAIIEFANSITIQSQVFSNIHNRFFRDFGNVAAFDDFATDGYDEELDAPEPGEPANLFVSTYFPHPEWNAQFGDNFMVDVRDASDDLTNTVKTFTFEVDTDLLGEMADINFIVGDEFNNDIGIVLYDQTTGNYQDLREIDFYSFVTTADERVLDLRVGDATSPTLGITYPQEGDTLAANEDHLLTWTLDDITAIRYVKVSYSLDDGNNWTLIDSLAGVENGPTELNWTAPDEFTLYARIMVEAMDWAGNSSLEISDFNFTVAPFAMLHDFAANWHLASVPLQIDLTDIADIFGDDIIGPYYVYDYDANDGYDRTWEVEHGKGYWLALAEETMIGLQGVPVLDSALYELNELWNIVGTSIPTNINRNDLWFTDGVDSYGFVDAVNQGWLSPMLFGYNNQTRTYFITETMQPWGGYWIQALLENIEMITYPPAMDGAELQDIEELQDGIRYNELDDELSWRVKVAINQGENTDSLVLIGADTAATDGYDIWHDVPTPPAPMHRYVRALFYHPDWQTASGTVYSQDIRGNMVTDATLEWNMSVIASNPGEVEVVFADIHNEVFSIPDYEAWVVDEVDGRVINLRDNETVIIDHPGGEDEYDLTIKVSNFEAPEAVDGPGTNGLPEVFAVSAAYPNPFNPSTQVMISIPKATKVQARVFDILGREIAVLDPGYVNAGYHQVTWNSHQASGIYFMQISTSAGDVSTQKLVLMK